MLPNMFHAPMLCLLLLVIALITSVTAKTDWKPEEIVERGIFCYDEVCTNFQEFNRVVGPKRKEVINLAKQGLASGKTQDGMPLKKKGQRKGARYNPVLIAIEGFHKKYHNDAR